MTPNGIVTFKLKNVRPVGDGSLYGVFTADALVGTELRQSAEADYQARGATTTDVTDHSCYQVPAGGRQIRGD